MTNLTDMTDEQLEQELAKRKKVKTIANDVAERPLKCKTVTRIEVNYSDLEAFIFTIFRKRYDSASTEEMSNDTQRSYKVKREREVGTWIVANDTQVERYLFGCNGVQPPLVNLLNYLAAKNYIQSGDYLVKWSW